MKTLQELIIMFHEQDKLQDIIDSYPKGKIDYSDDWQKYISKENSTTWEQLWSTKWDIYTAMQVVYGDDPDFISFEKTIF
jgi:hypothetical protein